MEIRLAGIVKESVVDGPGFRYVVFTQGCHHFCEGCHNPDTHDINGGYLISVDKIINEIKASKYIDGVTISGGEPFLQLDACTYLCRQIKKLGHNIMCYTGFTFEQLLDSNNINILNFLELIDVLVDGPFIESQRDLSLPYRGSGNQRIIDVKSSLRAKKVITTELKLYNTISNW